MYRVRLNMRRSVELDSDYMFYFDSYISDGTPVSAFIAKYRDDYIVHTLSGSKKVRRYTKEIAYIDDAGIPAEIRGDDETFKSYARRIAGLAFMSRLYPFTKWLFDKVGWPDAAGAGFSIWGGELVADSGETDPLELPLLAFREYVYVALDMKFRPKEFRDIYLSFCAEDDGGIVCRVERVWSSAKLVTALERFGTILGKLTYLSGHSEICDALGVYRSQYSEVLLHLFKGFAEPLDCDSKIYRNVMNKVYQMMAEEVLS